MDFSAYQEKNIDQYNGKLPDLPKLLNPKVSRIVIFIFLWLLIFVPFMYLNFILTFLSIPFVFPLFITVIFMVLTWWLSGKFFRSGYDISLRLALFAQRNKFTYKMNVNNHNTNGYTGSLIGKTNLSNLVTGQFEGYDFSLFSTYGKIFYIVLKINLPNRFPHIFLDCKSNNFVVTSNFPAQFPKDAEINLEGNFSEYFRAFSAGSNVETLQILSPELMQRIITYPRQADIEIVDDQLQIILNFKTIKEEDVRMIFDTAEQILKDIGVNSNNSKVIFDNSKRLVG